MNELIYNGQRLKIQLASRDENNSNTGIDLTDAQSLNIKIKVGNTTTSHTATVVIDDAYSCYVDYNIASVGRHYVWIEAIISETEKYIGRPFEFEVVAEGKP